MLYISDICHIFIFSKIPFVIHFLIYVSFIIVGLRYELDFYTLAGPLSTSSARKKKGGVYSLFALSVCKKNVFHNMIPFQMRQKEANCITLTEFYSLHNIQFAIV